jgi:hypothetical protein
MGLPISTAMQANPDQDSEAEKKSATQNVFEIK